jgi:hypothetical protein
VIVDERTYHIRPGYLKEWLDNYEKYGLQPQLRIQGNLIGFFTTEVGELHSVVHMWGYESMAERERLRKILYADPEWLHYIDINTKLIARMENRILISTSFSPL